MKKLFFLVITVLFLAAPNTKSIAAAIRQQDLPVTKRAQLAYEPLGRHVSDFLLYPSVELMENFDNNIYAVKTGKTSDFITRVKPKLDLRTLNTQKGFKAVFQVDEGFYKKHDKENYTDYQARFSPFWFVLRELKIKADLERQHLHEQRSDPDAFANNASLEPVTYNRTSASVTGEYERGHLNLNLSGERAYLDFDNGMTVSGTDLINDDRNRFESSIATKITCNITDRSNFYWMLQWMNQDYKRPDFDNLSAGYEGPKRDSHGARSAIGFQSHLTNLISLKANIGLHHQNFSDVSFKDVNTGIGQAHMTWLVTPLTTIDLQAARDIFETNQSGASSYIQSQTKLTVSHELRRNIILQAFAGMGSVDYVDFNRNDDFQAAGIAAIYKMNRYLHWRLAYDYDGRRSNISTAEYDRQRVFLSGTVQF